MSKKFNYKKKGTIILLLCIFLLAQGCQNQDHTAQNLTTASDEQKELERSLKPEEYPETITETLTDHVNIDADVDIAEGFDFSNAKLGIGTLYTIDCEEAEKIFMGNTEIVSVDDEKNQKGIRNVFYTGADHSYLDINPEEGYLSYYTELLTYIKQSFRKDEKLSSYNGECYNMSEDLPFADRKEVVKKIRNKLGKLGIVIGNDYICYALPHKTMEEQEIAYNKYGDESEENKKEKWTEEDDCYYFEFKPEFDGIPVDIEGYGDCEDGKGMESSDFTVIYGKNGFVEVSIINLYDISDTGNTDKMLTPQEALAALKEKYDALILTEDYLVEHMELCYMPIFDAKGKYPVEPVWIFTVVTTDKETGYEYRDRVIIDRNGKEVF